MAVNGGACLCSDNSAGDGGGLGLAVLLGCGLETADQISQMLPFCGQRTANFPLQNQKKPVKVAAGGGETVTSEVNCWSSDQLHHPKALTSDITPERGFSVVVN